MTFSENRFGYTTLFLGALALLTVCVHLYAGPFAPQPKASVTVGELASDIGKSAVRDFFGLSQPEAQVQPWTIDRAIHLATAIAAALAVILAGVGFALREPKRVAAVSAFLGITAISLKFFAMLFFALLGLLLIWMVLQFMTDLIPWA